MKTRVRIAFTVESEDGDLIALLEELEDLISLGVSDDLEDIHLVATRGGVKLAELGESPKEKP